MASRRCGVLRREARPGNARWRLAGEVSRALSGVRLEEGGAEERVVRLSVPVGEVDPLLWLAAQRPGCRMYWSARGGGFEVAAAGEADVLAGGPGEYPAALRKRQGLLLAGDGGTRYYGGARFDAARESDSGWAPFGAYRFVLPRFELRVREEMRELACNLVLPRDVGRQDEILAWLEALPFPSEEVGPSAFPAPLRRLDTPRLSGWRSGVGRALGAFREGRMGKVVLARRVDFDFEGPLDAPALARALRDVTPGCFHFYLEPEEGVAFLGASPERLYRREGRSVTSEAVAGTRPRGGSEADDRALGGELLGSEKDREEHAYVLRSIREELGSLCESLRVDGDVSEMRLATRRHLVARLRGILHPGVTDADLLEALHPTPAVGGYPREAALAEIRSSEPFDRGWYAGPVGWIGAGGAEFAVGIRSGLVRGSRLALFSGAGIVRGSDPEEEWAEIEQKISDFAGILGLEGRDASG
ncbi:isochorismate synthase [Rubrobacter xylanophilus]|uniref:isochorismate synthase n=1 Tax=Rubrobacter xylanophilus TaxID=49319 RepID=UPI00117B8D7D|nr:isochorismate synthase [Rubrobacter xylanophilus]